MDRFQSAIFAVFLAASSWTLAGCERDLSGHYRSYSEIESANPETGLGAAPVPGDDSQDSNPAFEKIAPTPAIAVDSQPEQASPREPIETERTPGDEVESALPGESELEVIAQQEAKDGQETDESPKANSGQEANEGLALASSNPPPDLRASIIGADPALAEGVEEGPPEVREIKLLVPDQTFKTEGPEGAVRVSYDDLDLLKVLNMEPVPEDAVTYFPEWLQQLNGTRIRIRGFMYPPFQDVGLTNFVLARDNQICCFGRNPKIYDLIVVDMREGETSNYIQGRPFDVVGVLHIEPEWDPDEEKFIQLYLIDDAVVIDR